MNIALLRGGGLSPPQLNQGPLGRSALSRVVKRILAILTRRAGFRQMTDHRPSRRDTP